MKETYQVTDDSIEMQRRNYRLESLLEGIEEVRTNTYHFDKTTLLIDDDKYISVYYKDIKDRNRVVSKIRKYLDLKGGGLKKLQDSDAKFLRIRKERELLNARNMVIELKRFIEEIEPDLLLNTLLGK